MVWEYGGMGVWGSRRHSHTPTLPHSHTPTLPAMAYLALRILFTVSFSHLLRLSQVRSRRPLAAAGVNYLVAAIGCAAWALLARGAWAMPTVLLGALAGFTYVTSLLLILPAMRESGVAVTG